VNLSGADTEEGTEGIPLEGKKTVYPMTILMPSQREEQHALPGKRGIAQYLSYYSFYFPDSIKPGLVIDAVTESAHDPAG